MNFVIQAEHKIKLKERVRIDKYLYLFGGRKSYET